MRKRSRKNIFSIFLFFTLINFLFSQTLYETEGFASYYSEDFHGKPTASGEIYDMNKLTCAHPYLPFNTWLRVTNVSNNKSVVVRVNDRGPFLRNRIIDLSFAAARALGMLGPGSIYVKLELVNPPQSQQDIELKPKPYAKTIPELEEDEVNLRFRTKPKSTNLNESITEFGIFDLKLNKQNVRTGYLVQLASFSSLKNALTFIHELDGFNEEEIFIYHPTNGIYRVVLGIFLEQADALRKKHEISKYYPQAFITTIK